MRGNSETQMGSLEPVEAQGLALIGGSPRTEVIFLNQDLAFRSTSIFRDLDPDFLGPLSKGLLNLIHQPRDRLWLVKFHNDTLDRIRARTDPTGSAETGASVEQMLDRV